MKIEIVSNDLELEGIATRGSVVVLSMEKPSDEDVSSLMRELREIQDKYGVAFVIFDRDNAELIRIEAPKVGAQDES